MIHFPNFERFGRANCQPPTQGGVIVALISFVVVVAVCVVFAIKLNRVPHPYLFDLGVGECLNRW